MAKKKDVQQKAREVAADILEKAIEEEESKGDRVPGKVVHGVKTSWTEKDQLAVYGGVEFTPQITIPITISGVLYQLIRNVSIYVPKMVKDVYDEYLRSEYNVKSHIDTQYGRIDVETGAGALPPEQ